MGEDIQTRTFSPEDAAIFDTRLLEETKLCRIWLEDNRFCKTGDIGGFELEAWLIDQNNNPAPQNASFLNAMQNPLVVPELSTFNVEFNTDPVALKGDAFSRMQSQLQEVWGKAQGIAHTLNTKLMMIGILPTLKDDELTLEHISPSNRFFALNTQILKERHDTPITLDIKGKDHLTATHNDVMLEAAATSFQVHLQVPADMGARFYNASKIASAFTVAAGANSPYLLGCDLWDETRIPLFEQAISVGEFDYAERVTFGIRYLDESLLEVFDANRQRYPVLLPLLYDDGPQYLRHLRLHNGTIWRWNRALIGFDAAQEPHLRIEHRVIPAGPTVIDNIANAALYYGLAYAFSYADLAPESQLPYRACRDNFYAAAEFGLKADIMWMDGESTSLKKILLDELLPLAAEALNRLGLSENDISTYLGIIEKRVRSGQNGATWQRHYMAQHKATFSDLCVAYYQRQEDGKPVHEWSF